MPEVFVHYRQHVKNERPSLHILQNEQERPGAAGTPAGTPDGPPRGKGTAVSDAATSDLIKAPETSKCPTLLRRSQQ